MARLYNRLTLTAALAVSAALSAVAQSDTTANNALVQMRKLNQAFRYLHSVYIEKPDMAPLVEKAVTAMLQELDPHSTYIPADEMGNVSVQLDGEFSGVGIEYRIIRDTLTVTNTIANAPAATVGILPDDRMVAIDGKSVIGIKSSEVPNLLRGKAGSKVGVEIVRRGTQERLNFTVTRDKVPVHTIDAAYRITPKIGYIKIGRFGRTTSAEFTDALKRIKGIESLIIDLRGNGGGVMAGAVGVAEHFLPRGATIVATEGRTMPYKSIKAQANGDLLTMPLAVLIDENSASASEILAGALQDWDRAVIIGRNSFGKGLVQRQFELEDKSAVRITVAKYRTPSGRTIQRPYRNGHRDEYYASYRERIAHPDSVSDDSTHRRTYRTLIKGREVFDGEGIMPDIVVAADTTRVNPYIIGLVGKGIMSDYTADYLGRNAERLGKQYGTFGQFDKEFAVTEQMLSDLAARASQGGVNTDSAHAAVSETFVRIHLKALIARRLFSTTEYYRITNRNNDKTFDKAVEVLSNPDPYNSLLADK
ncbi:MAG: S41 family peptidase [Alistipes sp.]